MNSIVSLVEVRQSPLHGFGLFAKVPIPRGTVSWRTTIESCLTVSRHQFELLTVSSHAPGTHALISAILHYGFYLSRLDAIVYMCDVGRYTNHSGEPNSMICPDSDGLCSITIADIQAGQELTEDYATYDRCGWAKIYGDFGHRVGCW